MGAVLGQSKLLKICLSKSTWKCFAPEVNDCLLERWLQFLMANDAAQR
jgi:hypothetical protein